MENVHPPPRGRTDAGGPGEVRSPGHRGRLAPARRTAHTPRRGPLTRERTTDLLILSALWLVVFSTASQVMILAPILPRIGEELHIEEALRGTLMTAYAVPMALSSLAAGPLSDRIGRRRILLLGTLAMSLALFAHGLVTSYGTFLAARALAGTCGGLLSGAAVSYVGDWFPYHRRGRASGWVMSGMSFGQIAGIPIGAWLAEHTGFQAPFLLFGVTLAGAFLLILGWVPQPPVTREGSPMSMGSLLRGYAALLRRRDIAAATAVYFFMFSSISVYVTYLPTWIEATLHVNGHAVALMYFVGGLSNVLTSPLAGAASDRVGRKPLIVTSTLLLAVVIGCVPWLVTSMLAGHLLFAVSMALVAMRVSPLQALLTQLVPSEKRGSLMSLTVSLGQAGIALGSAIAGVTYGLWGFVSNTTMAAALLLVVAALVATQIPEAYTEPPGAAPAGR